MPLLKSGDTHPVPKTGTRYSITDRKLNANYFFSIFHCGSDPPSDVPLIYFDFVDVFHPCVTDVIFRHEPQRKSLLSGQGLPVHRIR